MVVLLKSTAGKGGVLAFLVMNKGDDDEEEEKAAANCAGNCGDAVFRGG